jgi:phospholipase C
MTARTSRRVLYAVAAAGAVATTSAPIQASAAPTPAVVAPTASAPKTGAIRHVIVVMQSGHSFDNYFGTRSRVDGIPGNVCERVAVGSYSCVKPYHLNSDQARAGLSDTLHVTQKSINGGKMDGFVSSQPNSSIGSVAMGHLNGGDLPYYWNLADRFTLFDHFYAASPAGALPNRLVALAGQTGGLTSNAAPAGGIAVPTIFDQLDQNHQSWKYYVQGYQGTSQAPTSGEQSRVPLLSMPSVTGSPSQAARIVDTSQYFVDLAKGQLPAVSYVAGSVDSERSPQNPALGEAFVQSLINALMQSSAWRHTALLVTYDDAGGWYDHAAPPTVGGTSLGLRVPAILVSPYARPGYVDSAQFNTASIPALIEHVFKLPALTAQESTAGNLLSAVDVHQVPISPVIASSRSTALVLSRPNVAMIYVLYLTALAIAGFLIAYAVVRYRREADLPSSASHSADAPS